MEVEEVYQPLKERWSFIHLINPVIPEYPGLTSDDGVSLIKLIKCVLKFF